MGVFQYEKVKDPTYYGENRVAAHSDHRYYGSVEEMEQHVENFRHSLNGLWKFHYAKNYESTIPGFETPEYDCTKWDDIRVPAHIQMEGYDAPMGRQRRDPAGRDSGAVQSDGFLCEIF